MGFEGFDLEDRQKRERSFGSQDVEEDILYIYIYIYIERS